MIALIHQTVPQDVAEPKNEYRLGRLVAKAPGGQIFTFERRLSPRQISEIASAARKLAYSPLFVGASNLVELFDLFAAVGPIEFVEDPLCESCIRTLVAWRSDQKTLAAKIGAALSRKRIGRPPKPKPPDDQLRLLIEQFGNKMELAHHCGVSRPTVYRWLKRLSS